METLFLCVLSLIAGASAAVWLLRWNAREPKQWENRRPRSERFKRELTDAEAAQHASDMAW